LPFKCNLQRYTEDATALFLDAVSTEYATTITLAKLTGDKGTLMQALLELGDVKAREGDLHGGALQVESS
jgi:hypothetical protein